MQSLVGKATGNSPKRVKRKAVKLIPAKARLQYGDEIKEVMVKVPESGVKKTRDWNREKARLLSKNNK